MDYESRIKAAYPIHPEIFDRLYADWSTLVKFQRTRGVLRLMAAVIHSLWEKGDRNPIILPASIPIDDPRVQFELTRYLPDNWPPVIERDVDGANSLPLRMEAELPNLAKFHACRRVARTVYMGSAPTQGAAHRGIEDRRIRLGCMMPGESPAVFGDALRRLASSATYLYQDGSRYWYSTQPTVTKLAEDRAEQFKRDLDKVAAELEARLNADLKVRGDFSRIHPLPKTGADVPDDHEVRLVVLSAEHPYAKEPDSPAEVAARTLLESRGNAPRLYRNTLVFLAADRTRLQDLDEALRKFLAWKSILEEREVLNLDPHQVRQAETQRQAADASVAARLPETYQWLLVPEQKSPQATVNWEAMRLTGSDALAARASKKLRNEDLMVMHLGSTVLRKNLDDVPLWRGEDVPVRQLVEDFATYLYLPRVARPDVLVNAMRDGVAMLTWQTDTFGYAESRDDAAGRYRGLRVGQQVAALAADSSALLVKPDVARRQMDTEVRESSEDSKQRSGGTQAPADTQDGAHRTGGKVAEARPRRFHGTIDLDPVRVSRDASQVAEEVIVHLAGLVGAQVTVTLEIEAVIPDGAPDNVVRIVTENSRTLHFTSHGFEKE